MKGTWTYSSEPTVSYTLTGDEVWQKLEAAPGFSEELRRAEADLKAGKGTPFRLLRSRPSWWRRLIRLFVRH